MRWSGPDPANTGPTQIIVYYGDALAGQNIALTPLPPGTVSGKVTDNVRQSRRRRDSHVCLHWTAPRPSRRPPAPDGNYSISATAMNRSRLPPPPITAARPGRNNTNGKPEYTAAAAPVTATRWSSRPAARSAPINFVLTPISPTVTGTVTDSTTGTRHRRGDRDVHAGDGGWNPVGRNRHGTVTTDAAGNYASGPLDARHLYGHGHCAPATLTARQQPH